MPEHNVITDPNIHEPKGASSATAGQLLVADGSGGTTWENASGLIDSADFVIENVFDGRSAAASQEPGAVDTVLQVEFGPAINGASDPAQLLVDGTTQINEAGMYLFTVDLQIGKPSGGTAVSRFFMRPTLNGAAASVVTAEYVDAGSITKHRISGWLDLAQSDLLTYEFYIDSAGAGTTGGLYETVPSVAGWDPAPSARVLVQRFIPN